jgi:predicted nucleic acid-binding protein
LSNFRQALTEIGRLGLRVVEVAEAHVGQAAIISQMHGLLTNDAIIVALMQSHGFAQLTSADDDFDRVPGITRFNPI